VVQQVFLHAWSHAAGYDAGRGSLRTWLLVMAHRRAVDWVRRETVRHRALPADPQPMVSAEDEAISAAVAARVVAAVDRLAAVHREVVRLLYFEELTVREIAARLGIPEGTAKTRLRLARQRLAQSLGSEGLVSTR